MAETAQSRHGVVDVNESTKVFDLANLAGDDHAGLDVVHLERRGEVGIRVRSLERQLDVLGGGVNCHDATTDELVNLEERLPVFDVLVAEIRNTHKGVDGSTE